MRTESLAALGVVHAWLFGSVARDAATPESDIDVMVDLDEGPHGPEAAVQRVRGRRHPDYELMSSPDLPVGSPSRIRVKPLRKKYFAFSETQIRRMVAPS